MIHRFSGSQEAERFVASGKVALDPEQRYGTFYKKYHDDGDRSTETVQKYITGGMASGNDQVQEVFDWYYSTLDKERISNPANFEFLSKCSRLLRADQFGEIPVSDPVYADKVGKDVLGEFVKNYFDGQFRKAYKFERNEDGTGSFKPVEEDFNQTMDRLKTLNFEGKESFIALTLLNYNKAKENVNGVLELLPKVDFDGNIGLCNEVAWFLYENATTTDALNKALSISEKTIESGDWAYLDTYASLLYKLGKKKEAMTFAQKAIELYSDNAEEQAECPTHELLEKIKSMK